MPTYDYKCPECEHVQERFHKIRQRPSVECEKCGARMKKMMGKGAGVIFKGSGFYETDYRKPSQKNSDVIDAIKEHAPDDQLAKGGVDRKDL